MGWLKHGKNMKIREKIRKVLNIHQQGKSALVEIYWGNNTTKGITNHFEKYLICLIKMVIINTFEVSMKTNIIFLISHNHCFLGLYFSFGTYSEYLIS